MFNIFGLLVALLIAESSRQKGGLVGWESAAAAGVAIAGVTAFLYTVAGHIADRLEGQSLRAQAAAGMQLPESARLGMEAERERTQWSRRMGAMRSLTDLGLLGAYLVLCQVFGWVDFVQQVWHVPQRLDLLPNLLPYLGLLAGSWLAQVKLENALHGPGWRPAKFLTFQLRTNLMTIAPIVLVNAGYWALLTYVPMLQQVRDSFYFSEFVLVFALVLPVFALMPLAVRLALPTHPLPDGPLRRAMVDFARRRKLRLGGLYVWETGSRHFATAFVIGLLPGLRYVFFTDALLRRFSEPEAMAVFAHEMGHVRHRHLYWLFAFIISFSVLLMASDQLAVMLGGGNAPYLLMGALFLFAYAIFGFLSRRFERQADDFAARETSPELIAGVLLKIGMGNPGAMHKRGWRHFPIRQRVAEIALQSHKPAVRAQFDAQRRRGLLLFVAVTLAAMVVLAQPVREDVVSGLATFSLAQLDNARMHRASAERMEALRERTLQRTAAMRELDNEYAMAADQYVAVVDKLTGRGDDSMQQLARTAREMESRADNQAEREKWKLVQEQQEALQAALASALKNNTPWDEEYRKELQRRGFGLK